MSHDSSPTPTPRARDRLVLASLVLAASAYLLPLRHSGLSINDEGWVVSSALRMLEGEVLYRDVWVFYAPIRFHVAEWLFSLFGPSFVALRTLNALLIVASVAGIYRLARRFAPPVLASIPALTYAALPGPWHKAPYGFCTVASLLVLARYLERPTPARLAALGLTAGLCLMTRQDLGLAALATSAAIVAASPWLAGRGWPERRPGTSDALRRLALLLGSSAAAVLPVLTCYAAKGALGALVEAVFVRAFLQAKALPAGLPALLSPSDFAAAPEGRAVGAILLLPLLVIVAAALVLLRRLRLRRLDPSTLLAAGILAMAICSLTQTWPAILVRFLQSAIPFYLLVTLLAALAMRAIGRHTLLVPSVLAASSLAFAWLVIAGLPEVIPDDEYTGSARMLRHREPVEWLGEVTTARWRTAEEVRLVRAFFAKEGREEQYVFAAPLHTAYYPLLERRNPTRYTVEHLTAGNHVASDELKREAMDDLLASPTRFAIVFKAWWLKPRALDIVHQTLLDRFRPVREYQTILILERSDDPAARRFSELYRRVIQGGARPGDPAAAARYLAAFPDEPLAHYVAGLAWNQLGRDDLAIPELLEAARLDPEDPAPREVAAQLFIARGRLEQAAHELGLAAELRDGPHNRLLRSRLPGELRAQVEDHLKQPAGS